MSICCSRIAARSTPASPETSDVGDSVWWLPPYSPDLNPIETLWSKVKSRLRRAAADMLEGLCRAAGEAFRAVTPEEYAKYFRSCGYET
mgnify:CR=1 FL=1